MESFDRVKPITARWLRCLVAVAIASASLASVAQSERIALPDMGSSAENVLTDKEEEKYARAILMQMRTYDVLVDDPLISGYFSDMGFRLVANSEKPKKPFTFVVLDEPRVNAFAAPGGVVALHSGLILAADDEHEVAGVLAHEVAHITQLHLYRTLENTQRMTIPIALGMLAIALAGGGSGEAITGALASAQAMHTQMYINFTRANEIEADRIGIRTLSRAGYDPQGMVDFFDKMGRLARAGGEGPPEFLRTHPVSVNRIAEAKNRASTMPEPEAADGLDFYLVQARLRALLEDQAGDAVAWFRERIRNTSDEHRLKAEQYGLAIALQRLRRFGEARELLDSLLDDDPGRLAYQLQVAALDLESGAEEAALERLAELNHSFPGNQAIALQYSAALLRERDSQRAAKASTILREQILHKSEDPRIFELYARAANIAGDTVRASEAMAESYYLRGGITEAMQQLEMLSRRDDLDYYQRARISARLMEMRIMAGEIGEDERRNASKS